MQPDAPSLERLLESFCDVADRLEMPETERAGILGIAMQDWPLWSLAEEPQTRWAELARRLSYALPLMRLALANRSARLQ